MAMMLARSSGVAAVVVLWTSLSTAVVRSDLQLSGDRPLSYLALEPAAHLFFSGGLAVAAGLFVTFHGHLCDRYRLGGSFSFLMLAGMAGQFVAAVVPIGGNDIGATIHVVAALILGGSIPAFLWRFAADLPAGGWRRICYALFAVDLTACAVGFWLSDRASPHRARSSPT